MQNRLSNAAQFLAMEASYEDADVVVFRCSHLMEQPLIVQERDLPRNRCVVNQSVVDSKRNSPLLDLDLEDFLICDAGDVALSNGNTVKILSEIKKLRAGIINDHRKAINDWWRAFGNSSSY